SCHARRPSLLSFTTRRSSDLGPGAGFGSVYLSKADGTVEAYDQNRATPLWTNEQLLRRQLTAPVAFNSYVAVADYEGYLHLLARSEEHTSELQSREMPYAVFR